MSSKRLGNSNAGLLIPNRSSFLDKSGFQSQNDVQRQQPLPSSLYGRPVEEVDPFVFEDTFCVIAKKYGHNYVHRFSATRSLFMFGPLNPIRKISCRIITNQIFDTFIILVILCNCVTLALDTNYEVRANNFYVNYTLRDTVEIMEYVFLAFYTIEMVLKILARGFIINKFAYLRNSWNVLDFVVVSSSYITIITSKVIGKDNLSGGIGGIEFLRTLRVLRAMKTISILPGLKMMTNALLSSVKQLMEVMALTLFVLMIFALLAMQFFMGRLKQKCVRVKLEDQIDPQDPERDHKWYEWVQDSKNWIKRKDMYPKDEYVPCGNSSEIFGDGRPCNAVENGEVIPTVCLGNIGDNFDDGWTSFDNFFSSMLSTFQLITLDFWERLYDLVISTTTPFSVLFFLMVIFLGSYYLLNLMLAVVAMSYEQEFHQATQVPLTKTQRLSLHRTKSTFSFDDPVKLKVTAMTHYRKRTPSEREMIARTLRQAALARQEEEANHIQGMKKRKVNLHEAIMTLLGRRASMDVPGSGEDDGSSASSRTRSITSSHLESVPRSNTDISPTVSPPLQKGDSSRSQRTLDSKQRESDFDKNIMPRSAKTAELLAGRMASMQGERVNQSKMRKLTRMLRKRLQPIVNSWVFEVFIMICVITNTVLLASEHHQQPKWHELLLDYGNNTFTVVFVFEALIKLLALQKDYFYSAWNRFDLFVVIMSIVDTAVQETNVLRVVRSFRLLRVFKLAQTWITMKVLLNIIFSTFGALGNLTLVLIIVLYIFAVLGLQVVGHYYTFESFQASEAPSNFPRWNWQDFWYSFMMVFRVICGEWIEPLLECIQATTSSNSEYKCFLIYLPVLVVGNFIILNLFLALLLNSFDTEELNAQRQKELEASGKTHHLKQVVHMLMTKISKGSNVQDDSNEDVLSGGDGTRVKYWKGRRRFHKVARKVISLNRRAVAERLIEKMKLKERQENATKAKSKVSALKRESSFGLRRHLSTLSMDRPKKTIPDVCIPKKCYNANCMCCNCIRKVRWSPWNRGRSFTLRIVSHPLFEWLILGLIFASSVTLAFEDIYLHDKPFLQEALFYVNSVFTAIFVIEMLLKWYSLGLWTYFTSSWTVLDFFVVAVSLTSWYFEWVGRRGGDGPKTNFSAFKALRTLRALRPLRAISRWQGMKIVVNALMYAIPSIFNVLLVCLLFWLIFSIMGVQFFKGKFYKCVNNTDGATVDATDVPTKHACCADTEKYSWVNQYPNFDNVLQGYLTLFQVATFEGWIEAMAAGVDSTEVDQQPSRDKRFVYYTFFVIFIVVGAFFTLNLFIGVIIDNFNRLKKKYEGNLLEAFLTPSQRHYYMAMKKLGRKKPRKVIQTPSNQFLALFYDVAMSRSFEIAIFMMIFLNMVVMAFEYYNQRDVYVHILAGLNSFFTTVYLIEAAVKLVGLRHYYFTIPWNVFDFFLIVSSILSLALGELGGNLPLPPQMLRIVRVFRIGRVLRLIKAAKGIRKLLFALIVSLPALFNIGALLALITFIYAILGMALFGGIAKNGAIDEVFNFDTFLRSCMMLLRIMTAAGWNDVLTAMMPIRPLCGSYRNIKCGRGGEPECANERFAIMYLVTYLMVSYLIVINMYIAIILENFVEASREEEVGIVEDDLEMFYLRWSRYDPEATQFISFDLLSEFLASLDPPLGLPRPNIVAIVAFNLPIARGNKIHCLDILHALIKHVLGHIDDNPEFRKLQEQMEHKFRKQFPTRKLLDIVSSTRVWKMQHNAAVIIQRAWRAHRQRMTAEEMERRHSESMTHQTGAAGGTKHKDHNVLNKMGNLLHLKPGKGKRRLSINEGV